MKINNEYLKSEKIFVFLQTGNDIGGFHVMKYQTYIFDLDGTLLDTLGDLAASCNYALRVNGMPERSTDEVRRFVGNGVAKLIERAVPEGTSDEKREAVLQSFRRYYLEHAEDTTLPYDGILPMLQMLREKGCRVAVVSNKFMAATQALCLHYFGDLVEVAIGENEHIRKKPHADAVEEALRQLGADREGAVYVGDSDVDIQTARNSGLPCISVLWGFRDRPFLEEHGAEMFVAQPEELIE